MPRETGDVIIEARLSGWGFEGEGEALWMMEGIL